MTAIDLDGDPCAPGPDDLTPVFTEPDTPVLPVAEMDPQQSACPVCAAVTLSVAIHDAYHRARGDLPPLIPED